MTPELDAPSRAADGRSAVAPVLAIAQSEVRARWRALVLIGLLAGAVGALAIGGVSLARRTTTAYDRLGDATNVDDAQGSITGHGDLVDDVVELPMVAESWTGQIGVAQLEGEFVFLGITAGPEEPTDVLAPVVLEGRLPRPNPDPDVIEVAVRDDFQREFDVHPGAEFAVQFLTEDDYFRFDTGFVDGVVHGPKAKVVVVGVIRLAGGSTGGPPGFASAAALESHPDAWVGWRFFVQLEEGPADFEGFAAAVDELAAERTLPPEGQEFAVAETTNTAAAAAAVDNTATLLGRALLAFAGAAAVVGGFAVVQALARHHTATAGAREVERALGLTRTQRTGARLLTGLIPAGIGVVLTLVGVVLAARIEPIGAIHLYEPNPGPSVNVAVLAIGSAAVFAVVLAASALTSTAGRLRRSEVPARESSLVSRATGLGGNPPTVLGLRFALEPGRGARSVPVRSALTGAMVGLAGVVAGLVFVASLDRLVSSPARSAVPYDVFISDVTTEALEREGVLEDPLVGHVSLVESAPVEIGSLDLVGHALTDLRGEVEIGLEDGRLPRTPDEIAVGLRAARDLGVGVGDAVEVRPPGGPARDLAVVGVAVVPPFNGEEMGLNALLTPDGLSRSASSAPFTGAAVEATPGADEGALVGMLEEIFEASPQNPPVTVQNLDELGRLPGTVAAMVGSVAVLAIANALVVAVRRRGRDLAVLRAIGFTRRQTGGSVVVMALAIVTLGAVVGVPVGIAIGATLWRATAEGAFVLADPSVRLPHVVLPVLGAIVVGLVAAIVPAVRAAGRRASEGLRAE